MDKKVILVIIFTIVLLAVVILLVMMFMGKTTPLVGTFLEKLNKVVDNWFNTSFSG